MTRGRLETALEPLQKAMFSKMEEDVIFDEVEEGTALPYVQIGDDTTNPYDTKTNYGEETTVTLHAWSAGPGKIEAKRIMGAMLGALTASPLIVPGFTVDGIEREFIEVFGDGQVYHGVCRFRIYIKQN
jgi:hypothetical protein